MFADKYICLNSVVVCKVVQTATEFLREDKIYEVIKRLSRNDGWAYRRVDTTNQMGFPDILLLKGQTYWQIEAKILKKKELVSIEDDLTWQFGQLGYLQTSVSKGLNYMLAVGKGSKLAFIKGENSVNTKCASYPNFIR